MIRYKEGTLILVYIHLVQVYIQTTIYTQLRSSAVVDTVYGFRGRRGTAVQERLLVAAAQGILADKITR